MATVRLDQLPSTQTAGTKAPTAAASSQAGEAFTVFASDAVAGLSNAGAAAGGTLNLEGGDAKRLTSGNGNGGNVVVKAGDAVGSGTQGAVVLTRSGAAGTVTFAFDTSGDTSQTSNGTHTYAVPGGRRHLFTGSRIEAQGVPICVSGSTGGDGVQIVFSANFTPVIDAGLTRIAASVLKPTDGSTGNGWLQHAGGDSRNSSDVTNNSATMANVTGMSATVAAGRKYSGELALWVSNDQSSEGAKFDFDGGTATWTSFRAAVVGNVSGASLPTSAVSGIASDLVISTFLDTAIQCVLIRFQGVCNAAGTLIPRAAENSHTSGTLTVYLNSSMEVKDLP